MNLNNWERKVLLDALDIAYEDEDVPIFNDGDVHATQSRFSSLKEKLQDETPYVDQLKRIADSLEQLTSPPDPQARIKALEGAVSKAIRILSDHKLGEPRRVLDARDVLIIARAALNQGGDHDN